MPETKKGLSLDDIDGDSLPQSGDRLQILHLDAPVVLHRQAVGDCTLFLPAQDLFEIVQLCQRSVQVLGAGRLFGELRVEGALTVVEGLL